MSRNFAEWMNPDNYKPKPGKSETGRIECHTPLNERGSDCPFIVQTNGTIQVKREVILKAMQESGFERTGSCCPVELKKMCNGDEYKGNLEGFVNRLMMLIGISPST